MHRRTKKQIEQNIEKHRPNKLLQETSPKPKKRGRPPKAKAEKVGVVSNLKEKKKNVVKGKKYVMKGKEMAFDLKKDGSWEEFPSISGLATIKPLKNNASLIHIDNVQIFVPHDFAHKILLESLTK